MEVKAELIHYLIINIIFLCWWAGMIFFKGDLIYKIHTRFINLKREHFNALHYVGLMFYKILVFFFIIIPLIISYM